MRIALELGGVTDAQGFHAVIAQAMGFPDFYGHNMNAWIDTMLDLSRPGTPGMTRVVVPDDEDLVLELRESERFVERLPDLAAELVEATGVVNKRLRAAGLGGVLLLPT